MSAVLNPAQMTVFEQLRGNPNDRPAINPTLRQELQSELEAALRDIEGPLTVDKHMLNKVHACEGKYVAEDEFSWTPQNARGTIAHKAIELTCGGSKAITPAALVNEAMTRICAVDDRTSIADYLRSLDDGERAELRVASIDMVVNFSDMFPPLKDNWIPHAEAQTGAYIGNRRVNFRGKIDLKLGALDANKSNTLIIDIKTGSPSFSDNEDLRFYALLETLRTGIPPFRWANAYISTGRAEPEDLNEDILWSAAKRLVDGTRKIAELHAERKPHLTPGSACRFCPSKPHCPEALNPDSLSD